MDRYLDVVDVDRYDLILGATFCNEHKAVLDFGSRTVRFGKQVIAAYTEQQIAEILARRQQDRQDRMARHLKAAHLVPAESRA